MISPKQAAIRLKNRYPKLTITSCVELPKYWLFTAVEDPNVPDYDDPFYAIRKSDGVICSYSPLDDLDNFSSAKTVDYR